MILASSFYNIIYIVLAIFAILALGGLTGKERDVKKKELDYSEVGVHYSDMPDPKIGEMFKTYVGGARFYTDVCDLRCFAGFVMFDAEDEVPRVYRNDLKMMGHIPRERLQEYLRWCPGDTYPCVGYVLRGKTIEDLETELRVIRPYNREYVEREIKKYVNWVVMSRGMHADIFPSKYVPLLTEGEIEKVRRENKQKRQMYEA